jgi:acetylacetone-cleaving enzyme
MQRYLQSSHQPRSADQGRALQETTMEIKPKVREEAVQINDIPWKAFPDALSKGGIRWKMLHASPEMGAWAAIFECPAGSSFNAHLHVGPGEYLLTKGRMDVRGGKEAGGDTVVAPAYGYESANARHDMTYFPVDSEFYMTFLGPLAFIKDDGTPIAVVTWDDAQHAYA